MTKVLQPSKQPLDVPAAAVPARDGHLASWPASFDSGRSFRWPKLLPVCRQGHHCRRPCRRANDLEAQWIAFWQILPRHTCAQNPKNSIQDGTRLIERRPTLPSRSPPLGLTERRGAKRSHCSLVMSITTLCWMLMKKSRVTLYLCRICLWDDLYSQCARSKRWIRNQPK